MNADQLLDDRLSIDMQIGQFAPFLTLDPSSSAIIDKVRTALIGNGITTDVDPSPPHISIGYCHQLNVRGFELATKRLLAPTKKFQLSFSSYGFFDNPSGIVLFLSPVPNHELLAIHRGFYDVFKAFSNQREEYYAPGQFVPHLSLCAGIQDDKIGQAISICKQNLELPILAQITSFSVYDLSKKEMVIKHEL